MRTFFIILKELRRERFVSFSNHIHMRGGECLLFDRILRFFIVLIMAIVGGTLFELAIPTVSGYFAASFWHVELGVLGLSPAGLLCILIGTAIGHSSAA